MQSGKAARIFGWVLTVLIGLMLLGPSASSKFLEWKGKADAFAKIGFSTDQMFNIGVVEVICALLLLIPQTAFLGAILVTGYLGGATVTHLRVGEPFIAPVIIGVLMWVGLGLRRPAIFAQAAGNTLTTFPSTPSGVQSGNTPTKN